MEFGAALPRAADKTPGDLFVLEGPPAALYWLKPGAVAAVTNRNRVQVVAQGDPGASFQAWEDGFSPAAAPENDDNFLGALVRRQQRPAAANRHRYSIYLRQSMLAGLGIDAARDNGVKFYATVGGAVRAFKRLDELSGRYSHEVVYRGESYAEFETDSLAGLTGFTRGTTYSVLFWTDAAGRRPLNYKPATRRAAAAWEQVPPPRHVGRLIASFALPAAPPAAGVVLPGRWTVAAEFRSAYSSPEAGTLDSAKCLPDGQPGVVVRIKVGGVVTTCAPHPWALGQAPSRSAQAGHSWTQYYVPTTRDTVRRNVTLELQRHYTTRYADRLVLFSAGDSLLPNTTVEVLEWVA